MRSLKSLAAAGSAVAAATFIIAPATASASPAVTPDAVQAPDAPSAAAAGPAACQYPGGRTNSIYHCYRPDDIRSFYGMAPLTPTTNDGAGQTIVLVDAYGSPTAADDLNTFAQTFNGPPPNFDAQFPIGKPDYKNPPGNGSGTSGPAAAAGWAGEANLDVQWAYAIAPKAHIVLVGTPPAETQGVQGLPNLMKAIDWAVQKYPSGTVFSMSFGTDETAFGSLSAARSAFTRYDKTFAAGQAKHDTFFSSSGDNGTTSVGRGHHQTQVVDHPAVSYPNVSPYVTSVGGTQVQSGWTWAPTSDTPFNADGSYNPAYWAWTPGGSSQAVWNESWGPIGTGGGTSAVYGRPAYQDGVAGVVGSHRGVPDVAWNAAVNGGVLVYGSYFPKAAGPAGWGITGGTSASSPQVAALTSVANQARAAAGKSGIGDLNSVIYSAGFDRSAAFSDIVPQKYGTAESGNLHNNQMFEYAADGSVHPGPIPGFETTSGYDLTTGWGSPKASGYIAQLLAH